MIHTIEIEPIATPRPKIRVMNIRGKKAPQAYYPAKYHHYKEALSLLIKSVCKKGTYSRLRVVFYLRYPKGTPKYKQIEGNPHIKKPDVDNFLKGFMDALEQSGVTGNDSKFYSVRMMKLYTTGVPRIKFRLLS